MIFLAFRMIDFNDDTMRKVGHFSSMNWKDLFNKVVGDKSSLKNVDLAISLHNVLKETTLSAPGWLSADDCMSPPCLLYLMERLLILSSSFCDYGFMTRSSRVEWLTYNEGWGMCSNEGGRDTCMDIVKDIHHSLVSMVMKMINSQDNLLEWATSSKESTSYDILVMRLILLLSMICVNSGGQHCNHLLHLLGRPHFASVLPSTFAEGLIKGIKEDCLVSSLAVACEKIDNPLVIVTFKKDSLMAPCENAIFLNMQVEQDFTREMLMNMLY